MGSGTEGARVDGRMVVNDVRTDGLVNSNRNSLPVGAREQAEFAKLRAAVPHQKAADCFADAQSFFVALRNRLVDVLPSLLGHAKLTPTEHCGHVLRSRAHQGNLKIVNQRRTVHGYGGKKSSLHQVAEHQTQPALDDVASQSPDDGLALLARPPQGGYSCT